MSAKEMFERMGYCLNCINDTLIYRKKTDYCDNRVTFHIGNNYPMTYDVKFFDFLEDSSKKNWIPMKERREDLKHTCAYGHWQVMDYGINLSLHKAINKQIEELGWLNER